MVISTAVRSTISAVAVGPVFAGGVVLAGGIVFPGTTGWIPPGDTITRITGTKATGFTIEHVDGTFLFPPTDSEAIAECGEYDTALKRVRCRAEVRIWYDALGDTRRALKYARTR